MTLIDQITDRKLPAASASAHQRAAETWLLEQSLFAAMNHQIILMGGMGADEQIIALPDERESIEVLQRIDALRKMPPQTWRGLDIRHLHQQANAEFRPLDVCAALDAGQRAAGLSQSSLDFITLRDIPAAQVEVLLPAAAPGEIDPNMTWLTEVDRDLVDLTSAFRNQMVAEAEPVRHQVAAGHYVMSRESLALVDAALRYEQLRLLITPHGIFCAVVNEGQYIPFYWSPDGINTCQVFVTARGVFVLDALLACIWRDACVVQREFAHEQRGRKGYEAKQRPKHDNPVSLPRRIYVSQWGAPADRANIEHVTRSAHTVTASYPLLQAGHAAHDAAERAAEYHWPPPPPGRTFRRPHTRGEGADTNDPVKRVICRGLQVAKITLDT